METTKSTLALAVLRVAFGGWLLWLALPNLDHSFIESLPTTLETFSQSNPYGFYRWGIHHLAAPHVEQFGAILSVGQALLASALLIGFLTRISAFIGAFYAVNLFLTAGHLGFFHQGFSVLLLLSFVTLIVGDAGCYYGLDGFLFRKPQKDAKPKKAKFKDKRQKEVVEALAKSVKKQTSKKKKVTSGAKS